MKSNRTYKAVWITTILAAAVGSYLLHHPRPPAVERAPHEALGEVLAVEAVGLLGPGGRLIVIAREAKPFRVPANDAQLEGLRRAVEREGGRIVVERRIRLDPLRPVAVPPGDFYDLLRMGKAEDVIVSLLGPPELEPGQWAALKRDRPRVVAACPGTVPARVDLAGLHARGLLEAAVVQRPDAPARAGGVGQAAFGRMFRLLRPAELRSWPVPARPEG